MTQPKHVLFGTGAPKPVADVIEAGPVYLAPDDWTQVLDLRADPDQQVVRRLTLWAFRNVKQSGDPPPYPLPPDLAAVLVSVIDDTITTGIQAATERLAGYGYLPLTDTYPVKILDDYPVRGAVRVIAGADVGVLDIEVPDFVVLYGYYTIAGEEGSRAMCERRPLQIGNIVPVDGAFPITPSVAEPNAHETTDEYVDEISLTLVFFSGPHSLFFGDSTTAAFLADPRMFYLDNGGFGGADTSPTLLDGIPMRGVGMINGSPTDELATYSGFFIRY